MIFYLMGRSSSGKDTLYRAIRERLPMLRPIIPYTTRPKRSREEDGKDYHFRTREQFLCAEQEGRVIESRTYQTTKGSWTYYTAADPAYVEENIHHLGIGTPAAYQSFCRQIGPGRMYGILLEVEEGVLLERALRREQGQEAPDYKELCRRFLADAGDFSEARCRGLPNLHRYPNQDLAHCTQLVCEDIKNKIQNIK